MEFVNGKWTEESAKEIETDGQWRYYLLPRRDDGWYVDCVAEGGASCHGPYQTEKEAIQAARVLGATEEYPDD